MHIDACIEMLCTLSLLSLALLLSLYCCHATVCIDHGADSVRLCCTKPLESMQVAADAGRPLMRLLCVLFI